MPAFLPNRYGIDGTVVKEEIIPLVRQVALRSGAELIDLHSPFGDNQKLFHGRVHPNDDGMWLIAAQIYRTLPGQEVPADTKTAVAMVAANDAAPDDESALNAPATSRSWRATHSILLHFNAESQQAMRELQKLKPKQRGKADQSDLHANGDNQATPFFPNEADSWGAMRSLCFIKKAKDRAYVFCRQVPSFVVSTGLKSRLSHRCFDATYNRKACNRLTQGDGGAVEFPMTTSPRAYTMQGRSIG